MYDITTREMTSYGLKDVAVYFGITSEEAATKGERTYIAGDKIADAFAQNRAQFLAYLADDLRETKGIADLLLPTYFEQTKSFPILLQDATLRGTTAKIGLSHRPSIKRIQAPWAAPAPIPAKEIQFMPAFYRAGQIRKCITLYAENKACHRQKNFQI